MKTFKKALCVVLSIIMAMSCLSVLAFAENDALQDKKLTYSYKYYTEKNDADNAKVSLDELDKFLAQMNIKETVEVTSSIKFSLDLTSVNALCATLDEYNGLIKAVTIIDFTGAILGDLSDLELDTWKEGMKRGSQDITIVKELIELVEANKGLVSGICDGTIDLGVFANYVDLDELLGPDGVSGLLKGIIVGLVYEKDTPEYNAAYNTCKTDVDKFIYTDLLNKYAGEYLPGFTMDKDSKVEDIVCLAFGSIVDKYLAPALAKINIDPSTSESEDIRKLTGIVNLNGASYDLSVLKLDESTDLLKDFNGIIGNLFCQMVPGFDENDWIAGDYTKINDNIENVCRYLGTQTGLIPDADSMTFEEVVMAVVEILLRNVDIGSYADGVADCNTLEDMVTAIAVNASREWGTGVEYKSGTSYLVVLGDLLAHIAYDYIDLRDTKGNVYRAGGGKDVFEVINYGFNYFFFEKKLAKVIGLSVKETDTIFTKIDKLLDYFGETKSKGVSFDSKEFLLGSSSVKGLLDSIFTLDIENILELTVVPAIKNAGNVAAVEFIYKSIQYCCNNWAGKTMIPAYKDKAFTAVLAPSGIANMVSVLLTTLNSRKDSFVPALFTLTGILFKGEDIIHEITEATVAPFEATGKAATPVATVKAGSKTLVQGEDFIVLSKNSEIGSATATVKGIGLYSGSFEVPFNIIFGKVEKVTVSRDDDSLTLKWDAVANADGYKVYMLENNSYVLKAEGAETTYKATGLKPGTGYYFRVEAVSTAHGASVAKDVYGFTKPAKTAASKATYTSTDTTVTLSWPKAAGATAYRVDRYVGGEWKKVDTTASTSLTVKGLKPSTKYYFRIWSYARDKDKSVVYGDVSIKFAAKTKVSTVTGLKATPTSTSIKLTWDKMADATGYQIYQYKSGKWTRLGNASGTSYTVSKLSANKKYSFKVRVYKKGTSGYEYGEFVEINPYTALPKVTGVKVKKATTSAITLTWSKVSGAAGYQVYQYKGGKWVKVGTTSGNSLTVSKLSAGTTYKFYVRAYKKNGSSYNYGENSSSVSIKTALGQTTGLKAASRKKSSITLSWSKVTGATGYQVYQYKDGKWVKVGTVKTNKFTSSSLKRSTQYQYKVRAYGTVNGKTAYGEYSSTLKAKTTLI